MHWLWLFRRGLECIFAHRLSRMPVAVEVCRKPHHRLVLLVDARTESPTYLGSLNRNKSTPTEWVRVRHIRA